MFSNFTERWISSKIKFCWTPVPFPSNAKVDLFWDFIWANANHFWFWAIYPLNQNILKNLSKLSRATKKEEEEFGLPSKNNKLSSAYCESWCSSSLTKTPLLLLFCFRRIYYISAQSRKKYGTISTCLQPLSIWFVLICVHIVEFMLWNNF